MSLESLMTRNVIIKRPTSTGDRYNDQALDWDTTTDTAVKGWLAQATTSETQEPNRLAAVGDWSLYLPAGTDIETTDRVTIDDITYLVIGTPNRARRPSTGEHHVEVRLRAVAG